METSQRRLGAAIAVTAIVAATASLAMVGLRTPDLSEAVAEGQHAQVEVLLGQITDVGSADRRRVHPADAGRGS